MADNMRQQISCYIMNADGRQHVLFVCFDSLRPINNLSVI